MRNKIITVVVTAVAGWLRGRLSARKNTRPPGRP